MKAIRCVVLSLLVWASLSAPSIAAEASPETNAPSISIAFAGDIMLDGKPGLAIKRGIDPFRHVAPLLDAVDIRIGNLECVVSSRGKANPEKNFSFRAHPRTLKVLKRHFDAVTLANNHSGDFGTEAFRQMLDLLDQQEISYFGGGADLVRAHTPLLIERKGVRIALLGYNEYFPRSFEAGFDHPGIAWSEDTQVRLDIANARRLYGADLVIPVMHWGWEYQPTAGPRQRQLARLLIDAGADAVVGGHPHVTQDTEIYRDKPIIYSLGNFVFDELTREDEDIGWILRMELDRQGVARWRTFIVHLDKQGFPHPRPAADGLCWTRGQTGTSVCGRRNAG